MDKLLVITGITADSCESIRNTYKITTNNNNRWAINKGFTFYSSDNLSIGNKNDRSWSKVTYIIDNIKRYMDDYDYLLWIDYDLLITNNDFHPVKGFIQQQHEILWTGSDWNGINAGFMLMRMGESILKLWEYVYEKGDAPDIPWCEQGRLMYMVKHDEISRSKIIPLPKNYCNSYAADWQPGHNVLHLAGVKPDEKYLNMFNFVTK